MDTIKFARELAQRIIEADLDCTTVMGHKCDCRYCPLNHINVDSTGMLPDQPAHWEESK